MPVVIDTNVLVRLATGDHAHQHARAQALFAAEPVRVLLTVVLETEWVLRSRYGYAPEQFASFVHWLLASPGVAVGEAVFQPAAAVALSSSGRIGWLARKFTPPE